MADKPLAPDTLHRVRVTLWTFVMLGAWGLCAVTPNMLIWVCGAVIGAYAFRKVISVCIK